jgi:phosphate starvation-inducible PhoH-like protein
MTAVSNKRILKNEIKYKISLDEDQKKSKHYIINSPYSFIHGEAGTGKTLLACQIAIDLIFKKEKNKIIITRPVVATEDNGFLPGDIEDKLEPWMVPIKSNLFKIYDDKKIQSLYADNVIELIALTHFRGQTFDNSVCIVDEYQNLTKEQLRMALGRLGKDSIMIFCGDPDQIDLKNKNNSASCEIEKLKNSEFVYITELNNNHRHPAVKNVLGILKK